MSKKAVCLISGGMDSCVTAFIAKNEGYDIYPLTIIYGQRHKKEAISAKKIANTLKTKNHMFSYINPGIFGGSSLTNKSLKIEKNRRMEDIGKKIPNTYVPARNTIFLSIALAYAETIEADAIYIGATATDYSGYPDCRHEYFRIFQKMANIATKTGREGKKIKICTPLLNMRKSEIIRKGFDLNAPLKETWSCYSGEKIACGRCDSCQLRLKGFKELGKRDPIDYEFLPDWYDI
jgi:7-cyano-7-deazaguanine synthase